MAAVSADGSTVGGTATYGRGDDRCRLLRLCTRYLPPPPPSIVRPRQHLVELAFEHAFEEFRTRSRSPASIGSNQLSKRCSAVSISDCGSEAVMLFACHGVISAGESRNRLLEQAGDYAAFNFQPLPLRVSFQASESRPETHDVWLLIYYYRLYFIEMKSKRTAKSIC